MPKKTPKIVKAPKTPIPVIPATPATAVAPHHSGKGTRGRLNTGAEKAFFNSKFSK